MSEKPELRLTARMVDQQAELSQIEITLPHGGARAATLVSQDADVLLRVIKSHDALLAACNVCDGAITELVEAEQASSTTWVNIRAARHIARAAIRAAEPEKREGKGEPTRT